MVTCRNKKQVKSVELQAELSHHTSFKILWQGYKETTQTINTDRSRKKLFDVNTSL